MKKGLTILAVGTLTIFMGVMALHPFVPHHHDSSPFESSALLAIHTGVAERGFTATVVPIVFFEVLVLSFFASRLYCALLQRGIQNVDIPLLLPLQGAFRGGLLNTKSY